MHPLFLVDAFANAPFTGNPAGVCLLDRAEDEKWMQLVGTEMNQAETAFLRKTKQSTYSLRWFTPAIEVDLCGHATLASAHVLWETKREPEDDSIHFETASGVLTAKPCSAGIELDFPATPPEPTEAPKGLFEALDVDPVAILRTPFDYFVELPKAALVRNLKPNFNLLRDIDTRGIIVTACSDDPAFDFVSRFFAPQSGVPEDHATGSAHCALAPYWSKKLGRNVLKAYQASPRGGWFEVEVAGGRVLLRGKAFTVSEGSLR